MLGDKYILEPEAILDHSVLAEGKRMYLVKWKPKWVKRHELPPGVFEKWEEKKAKRAKMDPENPEPEDQEEEEEEGFRILKERRVQPGEELDDDEDMNGDEEDEEEEGEDEDDDEEEEDGEDDELDDEEDDEEDEDDEEFDEDVDIKEEPEDEDEDEEEEEEKYADTLGTNGHDLNTLSSIDRDIVLNDLPGDVDVKEEEDIKEEEDDGSISIPTKYSKPYS